MASKKSWFKYTDESGNCWRISMAPELADIGGLQPTDESTFPPIPNRIKPRYMYIVENAFPKDRRAVSKKVILERDRYIEIVEKRLCWNLGDKIMYMRSYYGECVYAK